MVRTNCVFNKWLVSLIGLFFIFNQGHSDDLCSKELSSAITTTKNWLEPINISLDPTKWSHYTNHITVNCTIETIFLHFVVNLLRVHTNYNNTFTSFPHPVCFFISKFEFLVHKDLKPVKTLLCNDTGGSWDIPWPFNYVFIRLHIVPYHLRPKSNFGMFQIGIQPVLDKSLHMPLFKNMITHQVHFPHEAFTDTCLKYQHEYKIIYTWSTSGYEKQHYQFRMVNFTADTAFCMDVMCNNYCLSLFHGLYYPLKCGMEVEVFIAGDKIMIYDCYPTNGYWCLPLLWTNGSEFIDVIIKSKVWRDENSTYEVLVSTNSTKPSGIYCVFKQTTPTTSTTTATFGTRQPWTPWSKHIFGKTTIRTYQSETKTEGLSISSIILVTASGFVFSCLVFCAVTYFKHIKRIANSQTTSSISNDHYTVYSVSNDTTGTQNNTQCMPTDIRAYYDQTPPPAPRPHTINHGQPQLVPSRRAHNYQIPSRNLAAQVLHSRNRGSSSSDESSFHISSENGLHMQNYCSATNANFRVVTSELNPQEEPPPPYSAALDMIITPAHSNSS